MTCDVCKEDGHVVLGASCPIMSPRFLSQVGLQVVGPRKIYHAGIGIFTSHNFGDD